MRGILFCWSIGPSFYLGMLEMSKSDVFLFSVHPLTYIILFIPALNLAFPVVDERVSSRLYRIRIHCTMYIFGFSP